MSGNRTPGVCVTGRNVTNYTNTELTALNLDSRPPKKIKLTCRDMSDFVYFLTLSDSWPPGVHVCWSTARKNRPLSYDHTTVSSPHPIRTAKLSTVGPN